MQKFFTSFIEFAQNHKDEMFRFWVYRRGYTPYEEKEAFMDESQFEDTYARLAIIKEMVALGGEDFLIGFQPIDECMLPDIVPFSHIEYYKLSEIRLNLFLEDNKEE